MDSAVFEKLGAVMSDPSVKEKIGAIISGKGREEEKPTVPDENPHESVVTSGSDGDKKPCDAAPPCRQPTTPSTLKNGRALLLALKPYMDESRCDKIERILSAMKLAELIGTLGNIL